MTRSFFAIVLIACSALSTGTAAQNDLQKSGPAANCPASASELPVTALYGAWQASFDGLPGVASVRLAKHPEYAGGVRGTIERSGGASAQLAGDIDDDGLLTLDESQDGRAISAVWSGELQPGSCGKEFKGTWRNAKDDSTHPFTLSRTGGRQ
jgi:hypothetical protein